MKEFGRVFFVVVFVGLLVVVLLQALQERAYIRLFHQMCLEPYQGTNSLIPIPNCKPTFEP